MVCWELQMHPRWGNVGLGPSDQSLCRVWLKSGDCKGSKRWLGHWPAGNAITTQLSPDMTYLDSTYYCFLLQHIMITLLICYLFWLGVGFCSFVVPSHELLRASHCFAIGFWMYEMKVCYCLSCL